MRFMFACGGTAGHINPAIAVAGRLRELMPDCEILFIGADGHMEADLVPRSGYDIVTLKVTNISRGRSLGSIWHNIKSVFNVIRATIKARKLVKSFRPDAVIGTGGYVCYPVLKAASMLGVPTAVHESNAVPGLTTRMLANVVDSISILKKPWSRELPCAANLPDIQKRLLRRSSEYLWISRSLCRYGARWGLQI